MTILLALTALNIGLNGAETNSPASAKLPTKEHLHLYLLMGQSNMAGRGNIEAED